MLYKSTIMKPTLSLLKISKELVKGGYSLYPHQQIGVKWLIYSETKYCGGILADEMGLGKTLQIISLMIAKPKPINLLICPASLVNQWISEINKFAPDILVHTDVTNEINLHKQNIFVVSYNKISRKNFKHYEYSRLICDEAHYFRNPKSKTFYNMCCIKSKIRWVLTGTPIQNYKKDIITLFSFVRLYGDINILIKKNMLRRTHESLKFDMPKLKQQIKFIKESNPKLVLSIENNYNMHHLEKIFRLKQSCIMPNEALESIKSKYLDSSIKVVYLKKINTIVKDVIKYPSYSPWTPSKHKTLPTASKSIIVTLMYCFARTNIIPDEILFKIIWLLDIKIQKTIIFAYFRSEIRYLYNNLNKYLNVDFIDGSVKPSKKEELLQSKIHDVLIIQINAGGTGLNLQHYNNVIFTGPQWNPTVEQQAIARVYRIGQINPVNVKRYICGKIDEYSIEKKILKIQQTKLEMINNYIK